MTTGTMDTCGACGNSTAARGKVRCVECAGIEREIGSELALHATARRQAAGWHFLAAMACGWTRQVRLAMGASRMAVADGHMLKAVALRARLMARIAGQSGSAAKVIYQ